MEWTQAQVVGASFFQLNKAADNFNDVYPVFDAFYRLGRNQYKVLSLQNTWFFVRSIITDSNGFVVPVLGSQRTQTNHDGHQGL